MTYIHYRHEAARIEYSIRLGLRQSLISHTKMKDGITGRAPHSSGRSRLVMTLSQINLEQHIKIWVTSLGFDLMLEIFSYKLRKVSLPAGFSLVGLE